MKNVFHFTIRLLILLICISFIVYDWLTPKGKGGGHSGMTIDVPLFLECMIIIIWVIYITIETVILFLKEKKKLMIYNIYLIGIFGLFLLLQYLYFNYY
jgi:hypothetical protein